MTEIPIILVKQLRESTGLGIIDCKKALIESKGNIQLAIDNIRKSGVIKAIKKSYCRTNEGIIISKIDRQYGCLIEINCQTDFVSNNRNFRLFADKVLNVAFHKKITDINILNAKFEMERIDLISKIGENINIRRVAALKGDMLGSYHHRNRIGVLVATNLHYNKELIKQLAMHITASKPEYISPEDIEDEVLQKEYQIQLEIAKKLGKSKEIAQKIAQGRVLKFKKEISLIEQPFIIDPSKKVSQILEKHNITVTEFIRFELGEVVDDIRFPVKKEEYTKSKIE